MYRQGTGLSYKVHIKMSEKRYGKPSMTNLPYELGKSIFEEIENSPRVDRETIRKEVEAFEKRVIEERKKNGYDY